MNDKKHFLMIDAISQIDEKIVDEILIKRFKLWGRKGKRSKKLLISLVACATAAAIVFGVFAFFSLFTNAQVPIYEGMTVNSRAKTLLSADSHSTSPFSHGTLSENRLTRGAYSNTLLAGPLAWESGSVALGDSDDSAADNAPNTEDADNAPSQNGELETAPNELETAPNDLQPTFGETYYAMPNEDVYIHIHLTNPAGYEILSFTLNGVKYSAYMFESGSDMETLILKYNVGEDGGLHEYTIDAIKYVDGENIKDVDMRGDRTVRVMVNGGKGDLMLDVTVEFDTVTFKTTWGSGFSGAKKLTSVGVYEEDRLLKSVSASDRKISALPLGKRLVLRVAYMDAGEQKTVCHVFETMKASVGFAMADGMITGLGGCSDSILYIDAPVNDPIVMYPESAHIRAMYFSANVKEINSGRFYAPNAEKIVFSEGFERIAGDVFEGCGRLKTLVIPASMKHIGFGAFRMWHNTVADMEAPLDIWYDGTMQQWRAIKTDEGTLGSSAGSVFVQVEAVVHCTDGTIRIPFYEPNFVQPDEPAT